MNGYEENEHQKTLIQMQIIVMFTLVFSLAFLWIVEKFWPAFFNYPYLGSMESLNGIGHFYPLFIYAAFMALISTIGIVSSPLDEENFVLCSISSVLAGIWEELGYRWLYICVAMIGIAFSNWLLGTFVIYIFGALIITGGLFGIFGSDVKINGRLAGPITKVVLGSIFIAMGCGLFYIASNADPLYWLYEHLFIPVINFITFKQFHSIFYSQEYTALFLFGMIAVNSKFKDGHKYQGPVGMLNAWIVGFILMYAMLTYGLVLAIALHVIYDLEFSFLRYFGKKAWG